MLRLTPQELAVLEARGRALRTASRPMTALATMVIGTTYTGPLLGKEWDALLNRKPPAPGWKPDKARAGRRILAMDISTKNIGLAWGMAGQIPEGMCSYPKPRDVTEAQHLRAIADTMAWEAQHHACGFAIFAEFYAARNMLAFRANSSMRGAIMAALSRIGVEALPVAEITCRKAAGVNIKKRQADEDKGYMKDRVRAFIHSKGMDYPGEDEADAAVLLLGAHAVIQIGETPQ